MPLENSSIYSTGVVLLSNVSCILSLKNTMNLSAYTAYATVNSWNLRMEADIDT